MSGQNDEVKNEAGTCGAGCSCNGGSGGLGKGSKWLISGAVVFLLLLGICFSRPWPRRRQRGGSGIGVRGSVC